MALTLSLNHAAAVLSKLEKSRLVVSVWCMLSCRLSYQLGTLKN